MTFYGNGTLKRVWAMMDSDEYISAGTKVYWMGMGEVTRKDIGLEFAGITVQPIGKKRSWWSRLLENYKPYPCIHHFYIQVLDSPPDDVKVPENFTLRSGA